MLRNKYNCKCQILYSLAALFVDCTEQWHLEFNFTVRGKQCNKKLELLNKPSFKMLRRFNIE